MRIIDRGNSNPDHINNENDTALLLAVHHGQLDISKKLLAVMKVNKHHKNNFNNDALTIAKIRNYTELFEYF
jgi:ankyrin repeat protein